MKRFSSLCYTDKIKYRLWFSRVVLVAMLVYMVVVGKTGGGDSRMMTDLAQNSARIIFFGGMGYMFSRIVHNKRLLKDRGMMQEQMRAEQDDWRQYLHDKSGGVVMDILLVLLLFATLTAALYNMPAFYLSFFILAAAAGLKAAVYLMYSQK